jgi:putative transposase
MIRTYKRKLKLTKIQEQRISSWIGACRVVYNLGMEIKQAAYKSAGKSISKYDLMKQLPGLKKDFDWIGDVPSQTLQASIDRLEISYQNFFRSFKKGGGYPKYASKKTFKSILFKSVAVYDNIASIPKVGSLRMFKDSEILGKPKTAQIIKEPTGYFICIQYEAVPIKFISENQAIGLDMGIAHCCIDSKGHFVANPKHFKRHERSLRIENRSLARKKKGSGSWISQSKKLSRLHHKIANVRKDFLHKESTKIAKANSVVYMEDLKIRNMSRSAKGNAEEHGKNVRAKSGLNRSILDCGWGIFASMLEYKTNVVKVDPKYTSQICNSCGYKDSKSRVSQTQFVCTSCGIEFNADWNAAKNILSQGMARYRQREALACA